MDKHGNGEVYGDTRIIDNRTKPGNLASIKYIIVVDLRLLQNHTLPCVYATRARGREFERDRQARVRTVYL